LGQFSIHYRSSFLRQKVINIYFNIQIGQSLNSPQVDTDSFNSTHSPLHYYL
jgi:hypothetical protein